MIWEDKEEEETTYLFIPREEAVLFLHSRGGVQEIVHLQSFGPQPA